MSYITRANRRGLNRLRKVAEILIESEKEPAFTDGTHESIVSLALENGDFRSIDECSTTDELSEYFRLSIQQFERLFCSWNYRYGNGTQRGTVARRIFNFVEKNSG